MNKYTVIIPFTGSHAVLVDANSEKDAITIAFDTANLRDGLDNDEVEYDYHKKVMKGNVFMGSCDEVEVIQED